MADRIRFAVLGAGRIGSLHTELLSTRIPEADVVGVADIYSEAANALAERFGIAGVCVSVDEMLEQHRPDVVLVCASTGTHEEAILKCAEAKVDVFVEKPLAPDIAAIERIRAAVEKSGIYLQVGFNRRFDPSYARVHEAISSGEVGTLHSVRLTSRDPEMPPVEYLADSGGLFMDMAIHDFDMVRFLVGEEPKEVYAFGERLIDSRLEQYDDIDSAVTTLRFPSGAFATIENSRQAVYGYDQRAEAFGSGGMASTDNVYPNSATLSGPAGISRDLPLRFFLERYQASYLSELEALCRAVRDRSEAPVNTIDGRESVVLAMAAERSRTSGVPVNMAEFRSELEL